MVLAPVVFAVRETVAPEGKAVTEATESALIVDARADAIEEVVVLGPLQLTESGWPFTVIVLLPES